MNIYTLIVVSLVTTTGAMQRQPLTVSPYYSSYRFDALLCSEDPGCQKTLDYSDPIKNMIESYGLSPERELLQTPDGEFGATFFLNNNRLVAGMLLLKEEKIRLLAESSFAPESHPTAHFIRRGPVYDLIIRHGIYQWWYCTKPC